MTCVANSDGLGLRGSVFKCAFAAVKFEQCEAFEVTDQVALKADAGIFPGFHLARARAGLANDENAFSILQDTKEIETERRSHERPAQVPRHASVLLQDKLRQVVVRRLQVRARKSSARASPIE